MIKWLRKIWNRFFHKSEIRYGAKVTKPKVVKDSYEELPKVYSKRGKTKKTGFWCLCGLGRIMPRYRKAKSPTFSCNHCHVPYVPKMARG